MSTDADLSPLQSDGLPSGLIERYWVGETSPAEAARVEAWFRAYPERHTRYTKLGATLAAVYAPNRTADAWAERKTAIVAAATRAKPSVMASKNSGQQQCRSWSKGSMVQWSLPQMVGVAAGIAMALGLSWGAVRRLRPARPTTVVSAVPVRDVRTKRGERATLNLADGTRVILAPESRLRIPSTYATGTGLGSRDIDLDGEAFFEVKHDAARPFRVRTAAGVAEDLGTAFVVTAYSETRGMRVLVASGVVAIHRVPATIPGHDTLRSRPLAVLQAGDFGQLDGLGRLNIQHGVDAEKRLGWTTGRLVFVGTPVSEVLVTLQRWYDVEFQLSDSALAAHRMSTAFDQTTSIQHVIEAFEVMLNVHAERHGRTVTLMVPSSRTSAGRTAENP